MFFTFRQISIIIEMVSGWLLNRFMIILHALLPIPSLIVAALNVWFGSNHQWLAHKTSCIKTFNWSVWSCAPYGKWLTTLVIICSYTCALFCFLLLFRLMCNQTSFDTIEAPCCSMMSIYSKTCSAQWIFSLLVVFALFLHVYLL